MEEIFSNVSARAKENAKLMVELALQQNSIGSAAKALNDYTNFCSTEEEKEFVEFYFNMKMEQLLNEK